MSLLRVPFSFSIIAWNKQFYTSITKGEDISKKLTSGFEKVLDPCSRSSKYVVILIEKHWIRNAHLLSVIWAS